MNQIVVMKKPIEVWQAVVGTLVMVLMVGTIIIQLMNKVQSQQDMINFLIENKSDQKQVNSEINTSLREVNIKLENILIELQNKQDKPR